MNRDEHVEVVGVDFDSDLGEVAVIEFAALEKTVEAREFDRVGAAADAAFELTAREVLVFIGADFDVAHDDVVAHVAGSADAVAFAGLIEGRVEFEAHGTQFLEYAEALAQVGVGLEEVGGVGADSRVCLVADEGVGAVVGCPAAVAGIDVDAEFVGGLCCH